MASDDKNKKNPKKKSVKNKKSKIIDNPFILQDIDQTLETNYMPYVMSVITSRAIPEIDGFKPSHRKLLYTMYKMGLLKKDRTKSANIVGQTMRLNPHGDGAIYETMVRLTRGNEALLHPFIDSKGNFGKQYSRDMAYAASRYTEAKLDKICEELFTDIDKNTVEFADNYDGTTKEPLLLPVTFPNLLVSPNQGIAVGMASSICSFNLKEVCTATIKYIENNDADLTNYIKGPDFSTGGEYIYNKSEFRKVYETGRGSLKLRAKWRFDKKNNLIEIFEIPFTTTIEAIIDKIISLVKANKIREINDVRDETDLKGLKIAIDLKRNVDHEIVMAKLLALTPLMDSFSCNFNALIDGRPKVMGIKGIIDEWVIFRRDCVRKKLQFDLAKAKERHHLLDGLCKIILDIDKAIKIIRQTEDDKQVIPNLMKGFDIDNIQAEYVAEIKLRNLNKDYLLKQTMQLDNVKKEIKNLEITIGDDGKIGLVIIDELKEVIKKYSKPRMTEIIYEAEPIDLEHEDFIEDYEVKLFLTKEGYFKKISHVSLRTSGEQVLKDGDTIIQELDAENKSEILFFSDKYLVYKMKAHEFEDGRASNLGDYLTNILELEEDEKIIYMTPVVDYSGYMIYGFENGKIAKIDLKCYETKSNRKKLVNAYSDRSPLVYIEKIEEDKDIIAFRDNDKAGLFNTSLISSVVTRNSVGVQAYRLKKNSIMSRVLDKDEFNSEDIEYYRMKKIPATGHFIYEKDKKLNDFTVQVEL